MSTRDDASDDLAPVTPLFGRRGGGATSDGGSESSGGSAQSPVPARSLGGRDDARAAGDAGALAAVTEHWGRDRGTAPHRVPDADADPDAGVGGAAEPEGLEAQRRRAENVSLHALSRRGVSSSEMTRLLRDRDLDESVVADEVARLEGVGLLDDAQLARDLVEQKQRRKGLGRGAVSAELRQRGLDGDAVTAALDDIDDDDEQARADEWARKRASSLRGLDRETAERRLHGYLQRRGYRSETVRRAIERALPRGGAKGGGVRFE